MTFGLKPLAALSFLVLSTGAAHAADITYTSTRSVGTGSSVQISITTDGVIGTVQYPDVVAFNIGVTDPSGSQDISSSNNGIVNFIGSNNGLTATENALSFNFSDNNGFGGILFSNPNFQGAYCLQNNNCYDLSGPGEGVDYAGDNFYSINESGVQTIATSSSSVSAAPEPASWALMIAGVGMVGLAFRSAKRRHHFATAV